MIKEHLLNFVDIVHKKIYDGSLDTIDKLEQFVTTLFVAISQNFQTGKKPGNEAFHQFFYRDFSVQIQTAKTEAIKKIESFFNNIDKHIKDVVIAFELKIASHLETNGYDTVELETFYDEEQQLARTKLFSMIKIETETILGKNLDMKLEKELTKIHRAAKIHVTAGVATLTGIANYNKRLIEYLTNKQLGSMEDLENHHAVLREEVLENYKLKFVGKEYPKLSEFVDKLTLEINAAFTDHIDRFMLKKNEQEGAFQTKMLEVSKYYETEMGNHLGNSTYIPEDSLNDFHLQLQENIKQKFAKTFPFVNSPRVKEQLQKLFQKHKDVNILKYNSNAKEIAIGIDLGTTNCCAAVYINKQIRVIPNSFGHDITPSYVMLNEDKTETVGNPAKNHAFQYPENTIFNTKRMIGRRMDDQKLQQDINFFPFVVENDAGYPKIMVHNKKYHPEQISAKLLKQIKNESEAYLERSVRKAVITVPAYFTDGQRQATLDAAEIAGLTVLDILNEPTAAAIAYKMNRIDDKPRKALIFDLGGGTFDVAVMEIKGNQIDILAVDGDTNLGGEDFDLETMKFCVQEFKKAHNIDLLQEKNSDVKLDRDNARRTLRRLQVCCELSKKELAVAESAQVTVERITSGKHLCVEVTRSKFNELNKSLFAKTIRIVDQALVTAKLTKDEIEDIVLVGGSTRILQIQHLLKQHFRRKTVNISINPDEAVAFGAAVKAAELNGMFPDKSPKYSINILDVTPMSYGIEIHGGGFAIIISKGAKIPSTHADTFKTVEANQTIVSVSIYQGEAQVANRNIRLGTFVLSGIPAAPAGEEQVIVEMQISNMGILLVKATSLKANKSNELSVNAQTGRLTKKQKECLKAEEANVAGKRTPPGVELQTNVPEFSQKNDNRWGYFSRLLGY